jgi:subtilisin family serine protease
VKQLRLLVLSVAVAVAVLVLPLSQAGASAADTKRYIVVFGGSYAVDGNYAVGDEYAVDGEYAVEDEYAVKDEYAVGDCYAVGADYAVGSEYAVGSCYAVDRDYAVGLVTAAGGTVTSDLMNQIGVLIVDSANAAFAQIMQSYAVVNGYAVVEEVGEDISWTAPSGGGGPDDTNDALESQQWSMKQIRAPEAHAFQAGWRAVDVGIVDTGIDANHLDFDDDGLVPGGPTNVDCARGRDSVQKGPGVGVPFFACVDNNFHGTHVAGIVAAQANATGVTGVAPNVTLVPIKVCDSAEGYCYTSAVVDGVTYAGDIKLDVINMSLFADDGEFRESTECKPHSDPRMRAFVEAVNRSVKYATKQGATVVVAAGNSDRKLSSSDDCSVVPQESPGVVDVSSLGPTKQKASYSSWGEVEVAAPGGAGTTGNCLNTVLSTFPGNSFGCIQGTSMASPHAAGVAALIVSQHGKLGSDGDVKISPDKVKDLLYRTTIDQGAPGRDECFGYGRIDALRAVTGTTTPSYDTTLTSCVN